MTHDTRAHDTHDDDTPSRKRFDDDLLRRLRNEIPIDWLIQRLDWPHKRRDGRFCFVCPRCGESETAIKRETNLGRCFHCETNFNPIDFTIAVRDYDFVQAVEFLLPLLRQKPRPTRSTLPKDRRGGPFSCAVPSLLTHSIRDTHC